MEKSLEVRVLSPAPKMINEKLHPMETSIEALKKKWLDFWLKINGRDNGLSQFQNIVKNYCESHRFYHNLNHLNNCLVEFSQFASLAKDEKAIEMALWYHDFIYNPQGKNSEEQSATHALGVAKSLLLPEDFCQKVKHLIMATKHNKVFHDSDGRLIADIDLASLGKPWEEFETNSKLIRKEYHFLSNKDFADGRIKFFQSLLARESIYSTPYLKIKYEKQAGKNLWRAITNLRA